MKTEILKINPKNPEQDKINFAAQVLRDGGVVVFPTETVYGLGANALEEKAVQKIFLAKGRPSDNPLIAHISNSEDIKYIVDKIPTNAKVVFDKFSPGPITIILDKSKRVPYITTGGLDTVAVRIPNHKIALELIERSGIPIAAPSANISGKPSPTCAQHVIDDLYGKVDVIIDGGYSSVGVESTVLDLSRDIPTILRPGGITLEQLQTVLEEVRIDSALLNKDDNIKALSPGMKYTHYSPNAEVIIIHGELDNMVNLINKLSNNYILKGKKVGIIGTDETKDRYQFGQVLSLGSRKSLEQIAANLFTVLRQFDKLGVDIILSESFENKGIGTAIMNRLIKAAGYNIINV